MNGAVYLGFGVLFVLLIAMIMFRDRIREIQFFGNSHIKMDPKSTRALAEHGKQLIMVPGDSRTAADLEDTTSPAAEVSAEVGLSDAIAISDELQVEKSRDPAAIMREEDARRAQLELVIDAAAKWGWVQAKIGVFKEFPHPVVTWDDDSPKIEYGTTDATTVVTAERRASWSTLASVTRLSSLDEAPTDD
ncbi:MAG: hypothetical protein ACJ74U_13620 [Jatrophihabitantaceae bacterium]